MTNRYLVPLFLMFLSATIYVVWVDATYKDIATQREKIQVINGYIADADSAKSKLDAIAAQYKAFPPDGDHRLQVFLPEKVDAVRLIIDMNAVAARHGITLKGPTVNKQGGDTDTPNGYVVYGITFSTTATYQIIREFLSDIERSLALRDIQTISFTSAGEADTNVDSSQAEYAVYNFTVRLNTYGLN